MFVKVDSRPHLQIWDPIQKPSAAKVHLLYLLQPRLLSVLTSLSWSYVMAGVGLRVNQKVFSVFGFLSIALLLMITNGYAFEFRVGGGNWSVPNDPNAVVYNQWAEKHRFHIGDSILFTYNNNHDSVLLVTKDDYAGCNSGAPIEKFTDRHTSYKFNQSGAYYFISGVSKNCHKNEKMVVIVMADRSSHNSTSSSPPSPAPEVSSPSPAPAGLSPPSPAPEMSPPSPAPTGEVASSPPPSGEESNPTPAPSGKSSPPKNSASRFARGVLGAAVVVLFGASFVLV